MSPLARYCDQYPKRARWVYAATCAVVALLFSIAVETLLFHFYYAGTAISLKVVFLITIISSFLSGLISWQNIEYRSRIYMLILSAYTVAMAHYVFVFLGTFLWLWAGQGGLKGMFLSENLFFNLSALTIGPLFYGTLAIFLSLGLPFIFGAASSLLFANIGRSERKEGEHFL